jgi:hypothetical protein
MSRKASRYQVHRAALRGGGDGARTVSGVVPLTAILTIALTSQPPCCIERRAKRSLARQLMVASMESGERTSAFWMAEATRAKAMAEPMKNPLAKRGMERIAECYEGFARRAESLTGQSLTAGASRGRLPIS